MPFSSQQVEQLNAALDPARIHTRRKQGVDLRYVEGFDVIDTANAIFGYHAWSYQVIKLELAAGVWIATVLLTVTTPTGESASREDVGVGIPATPRGQEPTPDATETAVKAAVTDALKRALRTFGNAFGNSLYSKDDDGEEHEARSAPTAAVKAAPAAKPATATLTSEEQQPYWTRIRRYATDGGVKRDALNEYTKSYLHNTLHLEGWNLLTRAQWSEFERAAALYCGQEPLQTPPAADNGEPSPCPTCGAAMVYKEGTNKAGKAYAGYFCSDRNCKQTPVWAER